MFGMRGLYSIVLGAGSTTDDSALMQQQMGMAAGGGQPGQQPDYNKLYATEAENLQITEHKFHLFLSHTWSNAQDQVRQIKTGCLQAMPTVKVFLE